MTVRVVIEPAVEPVSIVQAMAWLPGDANDLQTDVIGLLIAALRQYGENLTGRAWLTQTLELTLDCFPAKHVIELPRPPLQSVTSVKYIDINGDLQTLDASLYQTDSYSEPARIKPAYLAYWPVTRSDYNALQVRYIAGYAIGSPSTDNALPEALKQWLKIRLKTLYDNRDEIIQGRIGENIPRDFVDGLLDRYIVINPLDPTPFDQNPIYPWVT